MVFSRLAVGLRTTAVFVLVSLFTSPVRASVLPFTDLQQIGSRKLDIPGCVATGSYDATSMIWRQFDRDGCGLNWTLPGPDGTPVRVEGFEARLQGRVDHAGNVLNGQFMAFGTIPALGITEPALLMRGALFEVYYGPPLLTEQISSGVGVNALVDLDFALPLFANPGDILLWLSNTTVRGWDFMRWPEPHSLAWQTSASEDDYNAYTRTQYMIYARSVAFAPEPATLPLLGLGLCVVGAFWQRRREAR